MHRSSVFGTLVLVFLFASPSPLLEAAPQESIEPQRVRPANDLSGGIAEMTDGVPADRLGVGTHMVEWTPEGGIERPTDATPPSMSQGPLETYGFDMAAWMAGPQQVGPDKHHTSSNSGWYMTNKRTSSLIYFLKNPQGDTWDINRYDANYIYGWITEAKWNTPYDYRALLYNNGLPMTPRRARPGYPGEQIFIPQSHTSFGTYTHCVQTKVENLQNVIQQVWGPYDNVYLGGNMGYQQVVKMQYFYFCSGTTVDTCGWAEVNWYTYRYGWVRWGLYQNNGHGSFTLLQEGRASDELPGGASLYFPCFPLP